MNTKFGKSHLDRRRRCRYVDEGGKPVANNEQIVLILSKATVFFFSDKFKEFQDDNFEFNIDGGKIFKRVINNVKKENYSLRAVFLFPQCFQKTCNADTLFGKGLITKVLIHQPVLLPRIFEFERNATSDWLNQVV